MQEEHTAPEINFEKFRPSQAEWTPFILNINTNYSVEGMITRVALRVNHSYPMLIAGKMTVIDTIKKLTTICQAEGAAFDHEHCSQRELKCFKDPVLDFQMSLADFKDPEGNPRKMYRYTSMLEAEVEIAAMSKGWAQRVSKALGANLGQELAGLFQRISEDDWNKSFKPMIAIYEEARAIGAVCQEVKSISKAKSI